MCARPSLATQQQCQRLSDGSKRLVNFQKSSVCGGYLRRKRERISRSFFEQTEGCSLQCQQRLAISNSTGSELSLTQCISDCEAAQRTEAKGTVGETSATRCRAASARATKGKRRRWEGQKVRKGKINERCRATNSAKEKEINCQQFNVKYGNT